MYIIIWAIWVIIRCRRGKCQVTVIQHKLRTCTNVLYLLDLQTTNYKV